MEDRSHVQLNNLLYSCVVDKQRANEQFVPEHVLGYMISGEVHLQTPEGIKVFSPGGIGFSRRNQLVKAVKVPPPTGKFEAINIAIDQDFLRRYSAEHGIPPMPPYTGHQLLLLPPDPFLKGYFESLIPYFIHGAPISKQLAELKTREAVELLLTFNPDLKYLLFDFSEPHKIDLEAYMNRHFMFNVSMLQFARLTGRSLAGFKRDFEKIFRTPPGQWLQQKRLNEARYLITEKGRKPSEVYLDVGFENLSHFSYTFKKAFGVSPSLL